MTDSEAATILAAHNRWRRADEDAQMQDPKELGVAINVAVHALATIQKLRGENRVLVVVLRECHEVLTTIEPADADEGASLGRLCAAVGALTAQPESGALL